MSFWSWCPWYAKRADFIFKVAGCCNSYGHTVAAAGVIPKLVFGTAKINTVVTFAAVTRISVGCPIQRFPFLVALELQKVAMSDKRLGGIFDDEWDGKVVATFAV